ncbi:MAG: hypothetical protein WCV79_02890 [Candidatus Paceibacterota bacterium]|jgi:hypothetical protein
MLQSNSIINLKWAKRGVVGSIVATLIITALEFPPPIGFETRPQDNVSLLWLAYFFVILIAEISAIPLIYKRPKLGAYFAITAAVLNIIFVIADQTHLLQPEVATTLYSIIEGVGVIVSVTLVYFAWKVRRIYSNSLINDNYKNSLEIK